MLGGRSLIRKWGKFQVRYPLSVVEGHVRIREESERGKLAAAAVMTL